MKLRSLNLRYLILTALLFPTVATAQTAPNAQASLAASLASNLSMAVAENEQLKAEVAELKKRLAEAPPQPPVKKD